MPVSIAALLRRLSCITLLFWLSGSLYAQTKPVEGLRDNAPAIHALTNATVITAPGTTLEKATVLIADGKITAVGTAVTIPKSARVWDYSGKIIYPGLIDVFSSLGMPEKVEEDQKSAGASHWNEKVLTQLAAEQLYTVKESDLEALHKQGFTAAWLVPQNGIFRGSSAVVSLGDSDLSKRLISSNIAQHISFSGGGGGYPSSLMGIIALIRQTFLDAQWYAQAQSAYRLNPAQTPPETNEALAELQDVLAGRQSVVFEVGDDLEFLRAMKIANEFGLKALIKGSGMEYRQIEAVKDAGVALISPLNFPDKLSADTPESALDLDLMELQHWYFAPQAPALLKQGGMRQLFTRDGLDKKQNLHGQLRKAIERGLSEDAALAALTSDAAALLGVSAELGSIAVGKRAHLLVTDGKLFDEERTIHDLWIDGERHVVTRPVAVDARGDYRLRIASPLLAAPVNGTLKITGKPEKLSAEFISADSAKVKLGKAEIDDRRLVLNLAGDTLGMPGILLMSAAQDGKNWTGVGISPDGGSFTWTATFAEAFKEKEKKKKDAPKAAELPLPAGWGAYGRATLPARETHVLVKNATIWTSGPQGILENADMLVSNGKIARVGQGIAPPEGAVIIDATGKHVTPGLIDAHSHSGIDRGVNEGTQAVTAEVRIGDVVDSYDIAWYRELAGGLTVANQLHGSANPIGGQNSVVKLRWGTLPEAMKLASAPEGIKFALGENVKQSNWGERFTSRYPQTRMGVETIIRDRFMAARDYRDAWQRYQKLPKKQQQSTVPPRRDLELEALLEILNGERLIHCHSYRQDEILMLCRIAEEFGFKIGTFQHVLEGYKVSEAIRENAIGASMFSDWWAYKFEVYDAIPYNGALMHFTGANVSFNSDSNELARRLNTEAAKAVKYGGVPPADALKFVTLNPAIQLGVGDRIGSLEVGKDGDFTLWSGDPLSTYTHCLQTWVEGRKMFDRAADLQERERVEQARAELIQRYLTSGKSDGKGKSFSMKKSNEHSCRDH